MAIRRQERHGTRAQLTGNASNPLLLGELGYVTDEARLVIGNGAGQNTNVPNPADLTALQNQITANTDDIEQINIDLAAVDQTIDALSAAVTSQNGYGQRLADLESAQTTDEALLAAVQAANASEESRLAALEAAKSADEANITVLLAAKTVDENKITVLEAAKAVNDANITALQSAKSANDAADAANDALDSVQNTRLLAVESANTAEQAAIAALQAATTWLGDVHTWTPVSVDDPIGVFNANYDATQILTPGTRISGINNGNTINGIIVAVGAFAAGVTPVTFLHEINTENNTNALHLMTVGQTITTPKYSYAKCPPGFPISKLAWTIKIIYTSDQGISTPGTTAYQRCGTTVINVPIGEYKLSAKLAGYIDKTGNSANAYFALSSSNNSVSHNTLLQFMRIDVSGASTVVKVDQLTIEAILKIEAKTPFYLIAKPGVAMNYLIAIGATTPIILTAELTD